MSDWEQTCEATEAGLEDMGKIERDNKRRTNIDFQHGRNDIAQNRPIKLPVPVVRITLNIKIA